MAMPCLIVRNERALMGKSNRVFVAGHRGLVGSAIVRNLEKKDGQTLLLRTHAELDLADPRATDAFFAAERPSKVYLAAAKVGGVLANNTYPGDFIRDNLAIQLNVLESARRYGVQRLLFLGSSCIYPRECRDRMREADLMTGPLEPTNSPYAIAKIAGIEMCHAYNRQYGTHFLAVMPTNLYGENDNYNLLNSHVLPALMRKFHLAQLAQQGDWPAILADEAIFGTIPATQRSALEAACLGGEVAYKNYKVTLWGTGRPQREFLYDDDMAAACSLLMELPEEAFDRLLNAWERPLINIGSGKCLSIAELASLVGDVVGFEGTLEFDPSMPDGTPRKLMDVSRINELGWYPSVSLREGIARAYQAYLAKSGGGLSS